MYPSDYARFYMCYLQFYYQVILGFIVSSYLVTCVYVDITCIFFQVNLVHEFLRLQKNALGTQIFRFLKIFYSVYIVYIKLVHFHTFESNTVKIVSE